MSNAMNNELNTGWQASIEGNTAAIEAWATARGWVKEDNTEYMEEGFEDSIAFYSIPNSDEAITALKEEGFWEHEGDDFTIQIEMP